MALDRRDFLKLASVAGFSSVVAPHAWGGMDLSYGRPGIHVDAYTGNFFMFFHAAGGWDPTHLIDPKPTPNENNPNPTTRILEAWIETEGPFRFPGNFTDEVLATDPTGNNMGGMAIPAFFHKYANRLTAINGVDNQTNAHDAGTRHTWSGRLVEGSPSLGAYMAGTFNSALPMAFLAFGGFSETEGIAPRTRAGNLGVLANLAYPTRANPEDETSTYLSSKALELVEEAQWHRDQAIISNQGLPKIRSTANTLFVSRSGSNELQKLQEFLPDLDGLTGLQQQVAVAIAAYRAGISVSANLSVGGFDTHGNHDVSQIPQLEQILMGMDYAMEEAGRHGLQDKIVVACGSDFGRTPGYNDGNGKDHWSATSMLFMGSGVQGNTLIGETTPGHEVYGVNPDLSIDRSEDPALKITPGHIHDNIRKKYALGEENLLAAQFPLDIETPLTMI